MQLGTMGSVCVGSFEQWFRPDNFVCGQKQVGHGPRQRRWEECKVSRWWHWFWYWNTVDLEGAREVPRQHHGIFPYNPLHCPTVQATHCCHQLSSFPRPCRRVSVGGFARRPLSHETNDTTLTIGDLKLISTLLEFCELVIVVTGQLLRQMMLAKVQCPVDISPKNSDSSLRSARSGLNIRHLAFERSPPSVRYTM